MQVTRWLFAVIAACLLCGCFLKGKFEEQSLWAAKFAQGEASIVYRGHHGKSDGELLLLWSDMYGRSMGQVRLIYLDEYPGNVGFESAKIDENMQSVTVFFANHQGKAQITIPLVVAGTDMRHLAERNKAHWFTAKLEPGR